MPKTRTVAEVVTEYLEQEQMSARELSRRLLRDYAWGHHTTVAGIARGDYLPSLTAMEHLADAIGIKPDVFPEYRLAVERERLNPEAVEMPKALKRLEVIEAAVEKAGLPDHWKPQKRAPSRRYVRPEATEPNEDPDEPPAIDPDRHLGDDEAPAESA